MKNYVDVYFNLVGDVYAKYTVSAATQAEGGTIEPVFVAIAPTDPKLKELCEEEVLCFPRQDAPIYDDARSEKRAPSYYPNGMYTAVGALRVVGHVTDFLAEVAAEVWSRIDPRCGAKIPSRLYRNTANICADVLTRMGIPATVKLMPLCRENHNGLCNQYRVTVDMKVPTYPWKKIPTQDPDRPNRVHYRAERVYETLNFDFDVTNRLRMEWVWPGEEHFEGYDARVLRDGKPVKWVGRILSVASGQPASVVMRSSGGALPTGWESKLSAFLSQTSMATVVEAEQSQVTCMNL